MHFTLFHIAIAFSLGFFLGGIFGLGIHYLRSSSKKKSSASSKSSVKPDVERELLESKGAVNASVAIQMADGARKRSGADLAISITGIAGPAAVNSKKPVGLVYVGIASAHWANAESVRVGGNRHENKVSFVHFALETAINCWDMAKVRIEGEIAQKEQAAAEAAVEHAKSEAEKARRAAEAAAGAPWQDESWQNPGKAVADDNAVEWDESQGLFDYSESE